MKLFPESRIAGSGKLEGSTISDGPEDFVIPTDVHETIGFCLPATYSLA